MIGGVQTYVAALCDVFTEAGIHVKVLQLADLNFQVSLCTNLEVIGVAGGVNSLKKAYQGTFQGKCDLTVFAYFNWADWNRGETCIAIQHGVASDGFSTCHAGMAAIAHRYWRKYEHWKERRATVRILNSVAQVICVDLNFPNWVRAMFPFRRWEEKLAYIPNFGEPITEEAWQRKRARSQQDINVLIARRFEEFRGVLLMGRIVKDVADVFPKCRFRFAGSGNQEGELRSLLADVPNCEITEISYAEMHEACWQSDIGVVPTLWSEGTSLACIESMCAGSAVLVTNIGGLSNLILPGFNGLIVEPTYASLRAGLVRLLEDAPLRQQLGENAYMTAKLCFSKERWKRQVRELLSPHIGGLE